MENTMLFAIKPKYAEQILNGIKKYEYRKRFPHKWDKDGKYKMLIYESSPTSAIVGEVTVDTTKCIKDTPSKVWSKTSEFGGIEKDKYFEYFQGYDYAYAISVENLIRYEKPRKLEEYGVKHAPMSFQSVNDVLMEE